MSPCGLSSCTTWPSGRSLTVQWVMHTCWSRLKCSSESRPPWRGCLGPGHVPHDLQPPRKGPLFWSHQATCTNCCSHSPQNLQITLCTKNALFSCTVNNSFSLRCSPHRPAFINSIWNTRRRTSPGLAVPGCVLRGSAVGDAEMNGEHCCQGGWLNTSPLESTGPGITHLWGDAHCFSVSGELRAWRVELREPMIGPHCLLGHYHILFYFRRIWSQLVIS